MRDIEMRIVTRLLIALLFLLMAVCCKKSEFVEPVKIGLDKNRVRPCAGCMPGGRLDTVIRRNFK